MGRDDEVADIRQNRRKAAKLIEDSTIRRAVSAIGAGGLFIVLSCFESRRGNAERHQAEEDDEKGQAAEAHEAEGKRGKEYGCGSASVRQQHPDPGRDEEPRSHCGNPAKNVLKDRLVGVLEVQQTEHKTDDPGYQKKSGNGGDCPDGAAQICSDANGDADNVRAGQKLAQAHHIGEILFGYPSALIDGDAT